MPSSATADNGSEARDSAEQGADAVENSPLPISSLHSLRDNTNDSSFVSAIYIMIWATPLPLSFLILYGDSSVGFFHPCATFCPQCGLANELLMHTFRRCCYTSHVWVNLDFVFNCEDTDEGFFSNWIYSEHMHLHLQRKCIFIICLWKLWWYCNQFFHNLSDYPLERRCEMIKSFYYKVCQTFTDRLRSSITPLNTTCLTVLFSSFHTGGFYGSSFDGESLRRRRGSNI